MLNYKLQLQLDLIWTNTYLNKGVLVVVTCQFILANMVTIIFNRLQNFDNYLSIKTN